MQTLGSFLVSLVIASSNFAGAVPAPSSSAGGQTVSLTAKYNPNADPSLNLYRTYQKHGMSVPANFSSFYQKGFNKRQQSGGVVNTPQAADRDYLVPVDVGTPPQRLHLNFDTGSSDFWVYSPDTPLDEVNGQDLYDPSKSSTSEKFEGETWKITYADESEASGNVYWDKVTIGSLTVDKQGIGTASELSSKLTGNTNMDGVVGLAPGAGNHGTPEKLKTLFNNAVPGLKEPLFTANLKHAENGTYNFGYIDDNEYTGEITYTPNTSEHWWQMSDISYAFGDDDFYPDTLQGVVDTGATSLVLPMAVAKEYYSEVEGSVLNENDVFLYPCRSALRDFTFKVKSATFVIPAEQLKLAEEDGTCLAGIQGNDDDAIFGAVAMKVALVVFDRGNNQIGWAHK